MLDRVSSPNRIVIYVEDEESDVMLMQRAFTKAGVQADLQAISTGDAAIDLLAGCTPGSAFLDSLSLLLLDLNLPGASGFDVLSFVRAQPHLASLPVVVYTSSEHPADRARAWELGATDYWVKPAAIGSLTQIATRVQEKYLAGKVVNVDQEKQAAGSGL